MEEKYLNELPEAERLRIGKVIKNIATNYRELLHTLFVYADENGEQVAVDRKLYSAEELLDAFMAWTKGDTFEEIGDSVFQSGSAIPEEIFRTIGITTDQQSVEEDEN